MAVTKLGRVSWSGERTDEGHREYEVTYLVETTDSEDGPEKISLATGLPNVGDTWSEGNEEDLWAFCTRYIKAVPVYQEENVFFWHLTYKFSSNTHKRDYTNNFDNPLIEPDRISGSFSNGTKKVTRDRFNNPIQTYSFEPIPIEFDDHLASVRIEQNEASLGLATVMAMVNTVNNATLWGVGARRIKLSNFSWERKYYGTNSVYYTRTLDFDINFLTFDRSDLPNKGKKLIRGIWIDEGASYVAVPGADPNDPREYIRAKDKDGNPAEYYLTPSGTPSNTHTFLNTVEYYPESNFLNLGIPSSL